MIMNRKRLIVLLFVLAVVFSLTSLAISMDLVPIFGRDKGFSLENAANLQLVVEGSGEIAEEGGDG
jgi:lipopolysaccharide export LptBFGC system permease protein LptF